MVKIDGTIKVNEKDGRMYVDISPDLAYYYLWFIKKHFWISLNTPLHGAHVTIATRDLHYVDWKTARRRYHGKKITLEYDPYPIRGGRTKGFVNFWMRVVSKEIEDIKKDLTIKDGDKYRGLHITIGTYGKGTIPKKVYFPEMITIKCPNGDK